MYVFAPETYAAVSSTEFPQRSRSLVHRSFPTFKILGFFLGFFVHGDIFVSSHLYQAWCPCPSHELAVGFSRSLLYVQLLEILTPNVVEIATSACADNAECPVH